MCTESLFLARFLAFRDKKRIDYIRADFDRISKLLLFCALVDFPVSCSCLSGTNLVSLVPTAQHPFWPLGPQTPELRATSRVLKAWLKAQEPVSAFKLSSLSH